jgi:hypothetical protein
MYLIKARTFMALAFAKIGVSVTITLGMGFIESDKLFEFPCV